MKKLNAPFVVTIIPIVSSKSTTMIVEHPKLRRWVDFMVSTPKKSVWGQRASERDGFNPKNPVAFLSDVLPDDLYGILMKLSTHEIYFEIFVKFVSSLQCVSMTMVEAIARAMYCIMRVGEKQSDVREVVIQYLNRVKTNQEWQKSMELIPLHETLRATLETQENPVTLLMKASLPEKGKMKPSLDVNDPFQRRFCVKLYHQHVVQNLYLQHIQSPSPLSHINTPCEEEAALGVCSVNLSDAELREALVNEKGDTRPYDDLKNRVYTCLKSHGQSLDFKQSSMCREAVFEKAEEFFGKGAPEIQAIRSEMRRIQEIQKKKRQGNIHSFEQDIMKPVCEVFYKKGRCQYGRNCRNEHLREKEAHHHHERYLTHIREQGVLLDCQFWVGGCPCPYVFCKHDHNPDRRGYCLCMRAECTIPRCPYRHLDEVEADTPEEAEAKVEKWWLSLGVCDEEASGKPCPHKGKCGRRPLADDANTPKDILEAQQRFRRK